MSKHQYHRVNPANYMAINVLEQLGSIFPTQEQIDIIETLLLLGARPALLNARAINKCLGRDNIARRIFRRYVKLSSHKKLTQRCAL